MHVNILVCHYGDTVQQLHTSLHTGCFEAFLILSYSTTTQRKVRIVEASSGDGQSLKFEMEALKFTEFSRDVSVL